MDETEENVHCSCESFFMHWDSKNEPTKEHVVLLVWLILAH